ncbi:hypothetical protein DV096_15390 [Bradymonadaceae bacterium TMQ3]|uniref:HprK-related kinase B n=1 Tax=Lujinxingia sediminis TaxID=2480984 RepID=A0ABY0CUV9_9DELT|nr:hypothetical protein [Lujinxingia sediminis]RDV37354.1 hypothetical protein DV096_15390 [Bradymonadaceae bacterium TMQ3]RVU46697.1 hypothetical protein EA187_06050 [Lujinxingia sediminis]TXC74707.1 hypothetical protein FRC91_14190 [Bradymonadales bacterium TMQ1]
MSTSTYQLASLRFSIEGRHTVARAVKNEMASLQQPVDGPVDIAFRFVDRIAPAPNAVLAGRWALSPDALSARGDGFEFRITPTDNALTIDVVPDSGLTHNPLTEAWRRANDWNYLSRGETVAKNFMYDLFDFVSAWKLSERDCSYIHASTLSRDDRAVALIAWGGIGKTTSLLKLVTEDGWRFLSDDLGLINAQGRVFRTPRHLQIYAYNLEGQPAIARQLLHGRNPIDRVNWEWRRRRFGVKKVRRRVSAESLFGNERVAHSAQLHQAIFLERVKNPTFSVVPISSDDLAERAATILIDELSSLRDLSVVARSHGQTLHTPDLQTFVERCQRTLSSAFAEVPTAILRIPADADPDALADTLRDHLDL